MNKGHATKGKGSSEDEEEEEDEETLQWDAPASSATTTTSGGTALKAVGSRKPVTLDSTSLSQQLIQVADAKRVPAPSLPLPAPPSTASPSTVPTAQSPMAAPSSSGPEEEALFTVPAVPDGLVLRLAHPDADLTLSHAALLNDNEFHDVVFAFDASEYKKVTRNGHIAIVRERLPFLLDESKYCAKQATLRNGLVHVTLRGPNGKGVAHTAPVTPNLLEQCLCWAYTGVLKDMPAKLTPFTELFYFVEAMGLSELSRSLEAVAPALLFGESPHVVVATILPKTSEDSRLRHIVLSHVFKNWEGFIGDKEGGKALGIERMQELMVLKSRWDANGGSSGSLPESHPGPVRRAAPGLLEFYGRLQGLNPDCAIICDDGSKVGCHKAILNAASPVFKEFFVDASVLKHGGSQKKTPRDKSPRPGKASMGPGTSATNLAAAAAPAAPAAAPAFDAPTHLYLHPPPPRSAVASMLGFLYGGRIRFRPSDAVFLLTAVCRSFQAHTLKAACERCLSPALNTKTPNAALQVLTLAYLEPVDPGLLQVRKDALQFVIDNFTALDLGVLFSNPEPKIRADILVGIQKKLRALESQRSDIRFADIQVPIEESKNDK